VAAHADAILERLKGLLTGISFGEPRDGRILRREPDNGAQRSLLAADISTAAVWRYG
jgi:hypothetical protein